MIVNHKVKFNAMVIYYIWESNFACVHCETEERHNTLFSIKA